ncbi:MAG: hypothetical protein M3Q83_03355, partial [Pseudomonadota bacterium]|nr:hypothetical protein [Pseudomonadota bacterium]
QDQTIVAGPGDPNAAEVNTAGVVLPPPIVASKTYRCSGDNSVIYIDWYGDGAARVKSSQTDLGTRIPAPTEAAEPPVEGSAETPPVESPLEGTAEGSSVTYNGKTCNA